jgi:hypothetical protein
VGGGKILVGVAVPIHYCLVNLRLDVQFLWDVSGN